MALLDMIFTVLAQWASVFLVKPWLALIQTRSAPTKKTRRLPATEPTYVCIQDMLQARAATGYGALIFYPHGNTSTPPTRVSYRELYTHARHCAQIIGAIPGFRQGRPVLLHLDEHRDMVLWFWATLLANGLPVPSPPFSNVDHHRHQHIRGLASLLQSPICITRNKLLHLFDGDVAGPGASSQTLTIANAALQLHTIEDLSASSPGSSPLGPDDISLEKPPTGLGTKPSTLGMLMLTSGSTGSAKAVRITHKQILAAISGKASVRPLPPNKPFLNWIGLDHVASLVEIHLQALWLDVDQVHVHTADVAASPTSFLDLLSRHGVSRTFAPNFFLARLVSCVQSDAEVRWDLSNLTVVASGGEANTVSTCAAASELFERLGARAKNVVTPGFGMTETCAGAIFNLACPEYDAANGYAVASLGKGMRGIEMRIVVAVEEGTSLLSRLADVSEPGDLQVRGDVVFGGYYGNPEATAGAFTADGWFRTGDRGFIDAAQNLCLIGRANEEVVNINGVKIAAADVDTLLAEAIGSRVARFVSFPSRASADAHTEQITVCYVPRGWPHAPEDMAEIERLAVQGCVTGTSARPLVFSLREKALPLLPTSALGKIARSKMRSLFEAGAFNEEVSVHQESLSVYRNKKVEVSVDIFGPDEALLKEDFAETLGIGLDSIASPEAQLFELGFTSMDLIRLKRRLDTRLGIEVPVIALLKNPTVRSLAAALNDITVKENGREKRMGQTGPSTALTSSATIAAYYDPVVTFRSGGTKAPLWLVHPGVGEVLVFVGLAQQFAEDDRPIYALRARGFEQGQTRFSSITEAVDTYVAAVLQRQPHGPYALAGYSYGTMVAFEMAKRLDAHHHGSPISSTVPAVRFLGSFNLPPHIKHRMRQLSWNMCLLHLSYFLGLTTESFVDDKTDSDFPGVTVSRSEALAVVLRAADGRRLRELGLNDAALARWADVAFGLQSIAVDYEPGGRVEAVDVFHAIPLKAAAASREEWVEEHLSRWGDFCRTEAQFHAVGGAHYTMIGPGYVAGFAVKLRAALLARGV